MSTSYTQALHLPRSRQGSLAVVGLLVAALLVAASTVAMLVAGGEGGSVQPLRATTAVERVAGRGEMEYPGVLPPAAQPKAGPVPGYQTQTPRGGLAELPGLEVAPAAAAQGEAHGGLQEYPATR